MDIAYDFGFRIETGRERSLLLYSWYNLLKVVNTIFGLRVETGTERALMYLLRMLLLFIMIVNVIGQVCSKHSRRFARLEACFLLVTVGLFLFLVD